MKLDQAQYRELEAFSKFGSDLDAATKSVIDKGVRNVEILKQAQFTPFKVEDQVAIIYCGTKGLLRDVPVNKVREFEGDFLTYMRSKHADVLAALKAGKLDDQIIGVLENASKKFQRSIKNKWLA